MPETMTRPRTAASRATAWVKAPVQAGGEFGQARGFGAEHGQTGGQVGRGAIGVVGRGMRMAGNGAAVDSAGWISSVVAFMTRSPSMGGHVVVVNQMPCVGV